MGAFDIQAKVKSGLAKAKEKAGDSSSPIVYLLRTTDAGGSPINQQPVITETIELVDAVFKSVSNSLIDGTLIKQGDMTLVCNGDVAIKQTDIIKQGNSQFTVITLTDKSPFGISLAQLPIVRLK